MRLRPKILTLVLATALFTASCVPLTGGGGGSGNATAPVTTGTATSPAAPAPSGSTVSTASPFVAPGILVRRVVVNVGIQGTVPGVQGVQSIGNGSGIIIRPDGYILTNDHVVSGADGITATIGTQTVAAKVVGEDPSTDLAVIKVPNTGLTAASIGDPAALRVGDYVIAVGYPFGVGATVTHGIVSALGRSTLAPQNSTPSNTSSSAVAAYTDLIQTDAAINPGNSGGALATLDGAVVGVNTLIESGSGSSAGIGFAIPIDFALNVADQLIKTGKAVHPFLGVMIQTVTPQTAQQAGVTATEGVLVRQVQPNGAAAKAVIRAGDVIVTLAGMPVTDVEDLYAALRQQKIGQTVPVVVVRGGERQTIQVTIGSDKAQ